MSKFTLLLYVKKSGNTYNLTLEFVWTWCVILPNFDQSIYDMWIFLNQYIFLKISAGVVLVDLMNQNLMNCEGWS